MQSNNSGVLDKGRADSSRNITYLRIKGASCASCVSKIESALQKVDGVQEAVMNLAQSTVLLLRNTLAKETKSIRESTRQGNIDYLLAMKVSLRELKKTLGQSEEIVEN